MLGYTSLRPNITYAKSLPIAENFLLSLYWIVDLKDPLVFNDKSVAVIVTRSRCKQDFSIGSSNLLAKFEQKKLSELLELIKQFLVETPPTVSVIFNFRRIPEVIVSI